MDRLVPIEQVWVKPAFITTGGETKLHKVLSNKAVVIDAPAGAGKSTLARFISAVLARDRLGILPPAGISWQEEFLDVQPGPVRHVPLLVKSADIDSELGTEGILRAASPPLSQSELEELRPLLERGDVVFIVDGLDEVSSIDRTRIIQSLAVAREQWERAYFLVTTRGGDYQLPEHLGFTHAKLTSVSPEDARQLLRRWTQALFPDPAESARVLTKIQVALGRTHELQPMLTSPLSVAFLCWNYLTAMTLPTSRASLYENVSSWLLESRSGQRLTAGIDTDTTQKTLEAFAFSLLIGMDERGPVASAEIQGLLAQTSTVLGLSADKVERVIRVEASLGSCIEEDHGRIRFWHLSLRDYFAARWLLRRQLSSTPQLAEEIGSALWNPAWKECVDLFVGLLAIHHSEQVEPFLDVLGSLSGSSLQNRVRTAALRSRVLDIAIAHGYKPTPGYRDSLVAQFDETVQLSEPQIVGMSLEERVAVFSSLGVLQVDRRLQGKPSGRALDLRGDSSVTMGRYPVTVQEFARFVRDGAYENLKWSRDYQSVWHGWRAPLSWEEQKLMPNAPVVGVSWHEAVAYCRWLTEEDENVFVRLATMKEWREAVGDTRDETNIPRGAVSNDRFLPITPIGIRPERRGPNGHEDLGLIWEWLGHRSKSSRRNRLQMTADGELTPQWRNQRGAHRSPIAGFRIVLEQLT
jgi:hypothetical protein